MADSRWERVEELYHAALERDSSERIAFLQAACAGDESLRQEVESLLAEETEEEFLATPALEVAARELASPGGALIGRQFGPYQIRSLLGAGGMGEVYRGRDTKLGRDVAIKVLLGVVAHDPDRVARFAREARLLAALNHPHIAAIHGVEEADGVSALVLELVEGETLADRIARGPLPSSDAIAIAKQVADGLEAAHETAIVHRDLKPSNIKVRPDGNVKILDFGLAKALAPAGDAPHALTATRVGFVTGTPAYMSPEQARGQAVDKRADIWAFGCVFYEMLTGRQAFAGRTVTETLAAVMTSEPDWNALPRDLSQSLRTFLRRCLAKDVRQRIGDIHDMRLALENAFEADVPATVGGRRTWRRTLAPLGVAVALVLIAGLIAWIAMRGKTPALLVSRLFMEVPLLPLDNVAPVLDVSPEGTHIVYAANGSLWLRRLDTLQPWVVSGTEASNAHTPAFSPDGQWIAFYDQSSKQLKRVAIGGGLPVVVAAIDRPFGITWPTDDLLLYGDGGDGIWQVPLPGGNPERLIAIADGDEAQSPQLLPNGQVLFTLRPRESSTWQDARVVAQAPGAPEPTVVIARGHAARYLPSGHLLYSSSSDVLAAPFDLASSRILNDPVSVVPDVRIASQSYTDSAQYAVSRNGMLVYLPRIPEPNAPRSLVWVTRGGHEEPLNLALRSEGWVRVAPDGTRIAHGGGAGVFVSDIARPAWIPVANTPAGLQIGDTTGGWYPVWSHDSRSLVFLVSRNGTVTFVRAPVDSLRAPEERPVRANAVGGSGERYSLTGSQLVVAGALTRDDRELVFTYGTQISPHFGLLELNPPGQDPLLWKPIDRLQDTSAANLSRRRDWIAYHSWQDSGQFQVWIAPFPAFDQPKPISTELGTSQPRWSADGTELFYRRTNGAMMAVKIQTTPTFHIADPIQLFESRGYGLGSLPARGGARDWDLAPDGRFLMIKNASPSATPNSIVVVQNWTEELKRLVPVR